MLAHSIGLMPLSSETAIKEGFLNTWAAGRADAWPIWLESIAEFKSALARLLNGEPNAFSPQTNISSGLSKVLLSLPEKRSKNVILLSEHDFPSASFVLQQAKRIGFEVRMIRAHEDLQDIETWSRHLQDDVYAALITHVHYNTNTKVPVEKITAINRQRGILSIVDIAQSVGVVPVDLAKWNADIVVGSSIKWLCGGPGAGFLWVCPSLVQALKPIDLGWFSHKNPFEFDLHNFEFADDCSRFWGGTPSVLPFVIANNSIRLLREIGIDAIESYNDFLLQKVVDSIDHGNIVSPIDRSECGGTIVLKFERQNRLVQTLEDAEILFDAREFGIRLSPHIYTDESQIDQLISLLKDCD
jgi:selenocysteine lyase/cysteine desulfurase